jgi:hypothetical protein
MRLLAFQPAADSPIGSRNVVYSFPRVVLDAECLLPDSVSNERTLLIRTTAFISLKIPLAPVSTVPQPRRPNATHALAHRSCGGGLGGLALRGRAGPAASPRDRATAQGLRFRVRQVELSDSLARVLEGDPDGRALAARNLLSALVGDEHGLPCHCLLLSVVRRNLTPLAPRSWSDCCEAVSPKRREPFPTRRLRPRGARRRPASRERRRGRARSTGSTPDGPGDRRRGATRVRRVRSDGRRAGGLVPSRFTSREAAGTPVTDQPSSR